MVNNKRNGFWEGFRNILRPYRLRIVLISVFTVVMSMLQVLMALLSRFVIDAALGDGGKLAFWGVVLAVDVLAMVLIHSLLSWYSGSTSDRLSAKLRQGILRSALYSDDPTLRGHHSGELLSRGIEDVYTICDGAVNTLPSLVGQVARLVATFIAVAVIYPTVAIVMAVVAVLVGVGVACLRPIIKEKHRKVREADEKVMATMQEDMQQLELVQALGVQEPVLDRFASCQQESLRQRFKRRLWSVGSNGMINAASMVGSGVLLLWGASQVAVNAMSYGSLTALLQLLSLFRGPVLSLSGLWTRLAAVEVAAERLRELLQQTNEREETEAIDDLQAIVFENVCFSYPGEQQPVLENFNLTVSVDGWSCLTGVSGRGKTTLFKLILGLYQPQQGRVYLKTGSGEIPCTASTRHLFAYVPQDYALFSGTIADNLQLVVPELEDAKLRNAFSVAKAEFVWDLSDQEKAQLGENNTGLSKGQLQRLAIARAVLMERQVFLLDECTSALDSATEDAVLNNLHALGKAAVLVTHRPEAVEKLGDVTNIAMEQ